jgi:hypothetical protein
MQLWQQRRQGVDRLAPILVHEDDHSQSQARVDVLDDLGPVGTDRVARVNAPENLEQASWRAI